MRHKNEISLGEAIDAYLESRGIRKTSMIQRIIAEWPRIMGKPIAEHTEKIWFREGIFYVKINHPMWKQELSMAKSKVKELVNKELGEDLVQEVRIF